MDRSACILLIISFCCAGGISSGSEIMVYGSLGSPTPLTITAELYSFAQQSSEVKWKRSGVAHDKKEIIISYSKGNCTNFIPHQMKFHPENFSLEILETKREDANHYECTVTKGREEKSLPFKLEVYEKVSDTIIQMVNRTHGNDSCTMTLSCTVNTGDNVTYSWTSSQGNAFQMCLYNGSLLHLSLTPEESSFSCVCNASNRVSWKTTSFSSSVECIKEPGGSLMNKYLLACIVSIIIVVLVLGVGVFAYCLHKREPKKHSQLPEEKESCTIYAQVQRVEKQKSFPAGAHSECTTIYVSATALPPDIPKTQDPELKTVYDSVMLPRS